MNQDSFKKFKKYITYIKKEIPKYENLGDKNYEKFPWIYNRLLEIEKMMKKQNKYYSNFKNQLLQASEVKLEVNYSLDEILSHINIFEKKFENKPLSNKELEFSDESEVSNENET